MHAFNISYNKGTCNKLPSRYPLNTLKNLSNMTANVTLGIYFVSKCTLAQVKSSVL